MINLKQAALHYASLGWYVFPVRPGAKDPINQGGHKAATLDPNQINQWWDQHPNANIGIAVDPSQLIVYDVDTKGTKKGAYYHDLILDDLADTLCVRTASGGLHGYYQADPRAVRRINLPVNGAKDTSLDLIRNGYVLAPPSKIDGLEQSYTWLDQDDRSVDKPLINTIAKLPEILVTLSLAKTSATPTKSDPQSTQGGEIIAEGGRNNALFALACRLHESGLTHDEIAIALDRINNTRVQPPLPDNEILLIAKQATDRTEFNARQNDRDFGQAVRDHGNQKKSASDQAWEKWQPNDPRLDPDLDHTDDAAQVDDELDQYQAAVVAARPVPVVKLYKTGFDDLDKKIGGGIATRSLTVVMGAPAAGKTAKVLSLARNFAESNTPTLIVSVELDAPEICARLAAPTIAKPWRDLVTDGKAQDQIVAANQHKPIYVLGPDDFFRDAQGEARDLESSLRLVYQLAQKLAARYNTPPVIVIDYLQKLVRVTSDKERRGGVEIVAETLRKVAQLAPAAVIVVSSVARSGYGSSLEAIRATEDPQAYLALAKESGSIEYDAATVLFLDAIPDGTGQVEGNIVVAKARRGQVGFVGFQFDAPIGVFHPKAVVSLAPAKRNSDDTPDVESKILEVVTSNPGVFSRTTLYDAIKKRRNVVSEALRNLIGSAALEIRSGKLFVKNPTAPPSLLPKPVQHPS